LAKFIRIPFPFHHSFSPFRPVNYPENVVEKTKHPSQLPINPIKKPKKQNLFPALPFPAVPII